jgi:hypothetical protein
MKFRSVVAACTTATLRAVELLANVPRQEAELLIELTFLWFFASWPSLGIEKPFWQRAASLLLAACTFSEYSSAEKYSSSLPSIINLMVTARGCSSLRLELAELRIAIGSKVDLN